jgi:hypothetical protein
LFSRLTSVQCLLIAGISVSVGGQACTAPVVLSPDLLTCVAPTGAGGPLRTVQVVSNAQSSAAVPLVAYASPTIVSVLGCQPVSGFPTTIRDCPTIGNSLITLIGQNFGPAGAQVLMGSAVVSDVVQDPVTPHRKAVFATPSGTGIDRYVSVALFVLRCSQIANLGFVVSGSADGFVAVILSFCARPLYRVSRTLTFVRIEPRSCSYLAVDPSILRTQPSPM